MTNAERELAAFHNRPQKDTTNTAQIINKLAQECYKNSVEHGFWDAETDTRIKLFLIITEVVEAFESVRKHGYEEASDHITDMMMIDEELADVIIRVFDLSTALGINIGASVLAKMKYNESRPMLHGKNF